MWRGPWCVLHGRWGLRVRPWAEGMGRLESSALGVGRGDSGAHQAGYRGDGKGPRTKVIPIVDSQISCQDWDRHSYSMFAAE